MRTHSPRYARSLPLALLLLAACDAEDATAPGGTVTLANAMPAPSVFSVSANSPTEIQLSWQDNSRNESGFEVHRASTIGGTYALVATTGENVRGYFDVARTSRTQYCYRVRAVRPKGSRITYSPFSPSQCATTPGIPAAPTSVTVVPLVDGHVRVSWTDASIDESGYKVERAASDAGPWTLVAAMGIEVNSYSERFEVEEQLVCFRVLAYNAHGAGTSLSDCTARPKQPHDLTATTEGAVIVLAWTDASAHEDSYVVERLDSDYGYVPIATLPANANGFRDATAPDNVRHWYRVGARRDGPSFRYSNADDAVRYSAPPAAPVNVRAYPTASTGVSVYWQPGSENQLGYRVERSIDAGGSWAVAGATDWEGYGFFDGDRTPDQPVCYRVVAFNPVGETPSAGMGCTTPLRAPTALVATALAGAKVNLTWRDESSAEDGYVVMREECYYYYYSYCYFTLVATLDPGTTSFLDTGLVPGTDKVYQVHAIRRQDEYDWYSDPSNTAVATVLP
jgi:hypothetical protein